MARVSICRFTPQKVVDGDIVRLEYVDVLIHRDDTALLHTLICRGYGVLIYPGAIPRDQWTSLKISIPIDWGIIQGKGHGIVLQRKRTNAEAAWEGAHQAAPRWEVTRTVSRFDPARRHSWERDYASVNSGPPQTHTHLCAMIIRFPGLSALPITPSGYGALLQPPRTGMDPDRKDRHQPIPLNPSVQPVRDSIPSRIRRLSTRLPHNTSNDILATNGETGLVSDTDMMSTNHEVDVVTDAAELLASEPSVLIGQTNISDYSTVPNSGAVDGMSNQCMWLSVRDGLNALRVSGRPDWSVPELRRLAVREGAVINSTREIFDTVLHAEGMRAVAKALGIRVRVYRKSSSNILSGYHEITFPMSTDSPLLISVLFTGNYKGGHFVYINSMSDRESA